MCKRILVFSISALVLATSMASAKDDSPLLGRNPAPVVSAGPADYLCLVDPSGTSYAWIDATGGTSLALGDDDFTTITWPFNFQVYDDAYTGGVDMLEINSNGSIHFDIGGPRTLWLNCGDVPSTIDGQWVAPLGDDLNPGAGGSVWWIVTGSSPNRILTVEWVDVPEFSGGGVVDLQVNFYETLNLIVVQYREVAPPAFVDDGLVGLNAGDGARGEEIACASSGGLSSRDFDAWCILDSIPVAVEASTWSTVKSLYQ